MLPIEEKRIEDGDGAWLEFQQLVKLSPPIDYEAVRTHVEQNDFSDGMARCGQQGFNFRQVRNGDLETVKRLASPSSGSWEDVS